MGLLTHFTDLLMVVDSRHWYFVTLELFIKLIIYFFWQTRYLLPKINLPWVEGKKLFKELFDSFHWYSMCVWLISLILQKCWLINWSLNESNWQIFYKFFFTNDLKKNTNSSKNLHLLKFFTPCWWQVVWNLH